MTDIGDMIRFGNAGGAENQDGSTAAAFTDLTGAAADPTTVTLTILKPDGTQLIYGWPGAGADGTLTRESAGRFYMDVEIDQSGKWQYRLAGSGVVTAASEGRLRVQRQRVTSP
jgi:hypothetical protein